MKLVLDTNVVLDWLVFRDVRVMALQDGTRDGRISVLTSAPALDELRRVLTYPQFKLDSDSQREVLDIYRAQASMPALPEEFSRENLMLPAAFPRCRDQDDQHFLALAYHAGADALVSKDKDLLRVRRRAAKFGVNIVGVTQLPEMFR